MTNREKLFDLIVDAENKLFKEAPHYEDRLRIDRVAGYLIAHGVTVREPQKPLTVEELQEDTVCWYEEHNDTIVPVEIGRCTNFIEVYYIGCDFPIEEKKWEYGKTWRCWTEKPTDDEREAAEWE